MILTVSKPDRKIDYYQSRISSSNKQYSPLRIWLQHIRCISIDSKTIQLWLPEDMMEKIYEIDEAVIQQTIDKNESWFRSVLSESEVRTFFRSSCTKMSQTMTAKILPLHPPFVRWKGKEILLDHLPIHATDVDISVLIEPQWVMFYPQRFGIRWVIREIIGEFLDEPDAESRSDLQEKWDDDIEEFKELIEKDKERLRQGIRRLDDLMKEIEDAVKVAKASPTDIEWSRRMEGISKRMSQYHSGSL